MIHKINLIPTQNLWFTSDTHFAHTNICRGVSNWQLSRNNKTRDFQTLDEMNAAIVAGINSVVKSDDYLIHLGDWSFGGIPNIWNLRRQINCENIILVLGNHDHHISGNKPLPNCHYSADDNMIVDGPVKERYGDGRDDLFSVYAHDLFLHVFDILDLRISKSISPGHNIKRRYFCSHYPIVSWFDINDGVPHLYGHMHSIPADKINRGKAMDVGVDGNNFIPYSYEEIDELMRKQPIYSSSVVADHHL